MVTTTTTPPAAKTAKAVPPPLPPLRFDRNELIADIQRAVCDIWPDTVQAQIDHVARHVRDRWGGDRPPYVASDRLRLRDDDIRRLHRMGERIPYLARRFELSERQVARIVGAERPRA